MKRVNPILLLVVLFALILAPQDAYSTEREALIEVHSDSVEEMKVAKDLDGKFIQERDRIYNRDLKRSLFVNSISRKGDFIDQPPEKPPKVLILNN
jgi:hypothetical protein